jgi:hypothetical protein
MELKALMLKGNCAHSGELGPSSLLELKGHGRKRNAKARSPGLIRVELIPFKN